MALVRLPLRAQEGRHPLEVVEKVVTLRVNRVFRFWANAEGVPPMNVTTPLVQPMVGLYS